MCLCGSASILVVFIELPPLLLLLVFSGCWCCSQYFHCLHLCCSQYFHCLHLCCSQYFHCLHLSEQVNTAAIGRDARDTLATMQSLGTMYYMQEKYDQALPLIRECLELREKHKRRDDKAEMRKVAKSARESGKNSTKSSAKSSAKSSGKSSDQSEASAGASQSHQIHGSGAKSKTTLELLNLLGRCHLQVDSS